MTNNKTQAKRRIESVKRRSGLRRPKDFGWATIVGVSNPVIYYNEAPISTIGARRLAKWLLRAADWMEDFRRK